MVDVLAAKRVETRKAGKSMQKVILDPNHQPILALHLGAEWNWKQKQRLEECAYDLLKLYPHT